jgi:hypothetical protein
MITIQYILRYDLTGLLALTGIAKLLDVPGFAQVHRDLARFLTGSALGLGVLAKALPGRQALEGYARMILSVLA